MNEGGDRLAAPFLTYRQCPSGSVLLSVGFGVGPAVIR